MIEELQSTHLTNNQSEVLKEILCYFRATSGFDLSFFPENDIGGTRFLKG